MADASQLTIESRSPTPMECLPTRFSNDDEGEGRLLHWTVSQQLQPNEERVSLLAPRCFVADGMRAGPVNDMDIHRCFPAMAVHLPMLACLYHRKAFNALLFLHKLEHVGDSLKTQPRSEWSVQFERYCNSDLGRDQLVGLTRFLRGNMRCFAHLGSVFSKEMLLCLHARGVLPQGQLDQAFCYLVQKGHHEVAQRFVPFLSVDCLERRGSSSLLHLVLKHINCPERAVDLCQALLDQEVSLSPDDRDGQGNTPLHLAFKQPLYEARDRLVRLYLFKAPEQCFHGVNRKGECPALAMMLQGCAGMQMDTVGAVLQKTGRAVLEKFAFSGQSLWHVALLHVPDERKLEVLDTMNAVLGVEKGSNSILRENRRRESLWHLAARLDPAIRDQIFTKLNVLGASAALLANGTCRSPVQEVIASGGDVAQTMTSVRLLQSFTESDLLNYPARPGQTAIMVAAETAPRRSLVSLLSALLDAGAGRPLMLEDQFQETVFEKALRHCSARQVLALSRCFLAKGLAPHVNELRKGTTCFIMAVKACAPGDLEVLCKAFLEAGAAESLNLPDNQGRTVLYYVQKRCLEKDRATLHRLLRHAGASDHCAEGVVARPDGPLRRTNVFEPQTLAEQMVWDSSDGSCS